MTESAKLIKYIESLCLKKPYFIIIMKKRIAYIFVIYIVSCSFGNNWTVKSKLIIKKINYVKVILKKNKLQNTQVWLIRTEN